MVPEQSRCVIYVIAAMSDMRCCILTLQGGVAGKVSQDDSVAINLCCFATSVESSESCFLYPTVGSSQEVFNSLNRWSDFLTLGAMARFQDSWPVRLEGHMGSTRIVARCAV